MEKRRLIFCGIIFLISTLSFGAGYITAHEANQAPIVIEACSKVAASSIATGSPRAP